MAEFLTGFSNILWGAPVLILLGIVGLLYGIRTKFFQIRKMGYILKNTAGEMFKKGGGASGDKGTLTPLQAVCSALAGCVGTANIAGVATAMVIGGPGAVFWMWVIALLGMMTKCVEVTLGQYYRIQGKDGVYYGGPMYYIERGMGKKWKPLAIFFAVTIILGGLGTAAFAQPYTMSTALERTFHIPAWVVTVAAAAICGIVLIGGVKGIGKFCEKIPAWVVDEDSELVQGAMKGLKDAGIEAKLSHFAFCTNGSSFCGEAGIPCIGYGPSLESLAHVRDEYIEIDQLTKACKGFECILAQLTK